jgi:hypothetical protein
LARPHYISLTIDGRKADIDPEGQVPSVSYALEDEQDFEKKQSADSFNIELPATVVNDQIHNTLFNPSVVDKTEAQVYDNFRPAIYMASGTEILIGQYLVQSVRMRGGKPQKYIGKIYGLNGDWVIALKEKTLFDFVNPTDHLFNAATIIDSWNFNGQSELKDYVYAPVRYRKPFGEYPEATEEIPDPQPDDQNAIINDIKPSLSVYWILYRGFKSVGYKIVSTFMDTDYYRRGVLPWTWGGFDFLDDTRWEPLKFLAGQAESQRFEGDHDDEFPDLQVKADGSVPGTYDNSHLFTYTASNSTLPFMMMWQYPTTIPPSLGKIRANLSLQLNFQYKAVQEDDDASLLLFWYKNGTLVRTDTVFSGSGAGVLNPFQGGGFDEFFYEDDFVPGDWIGVRVRIHLFQSAFGFARQDVKVEAFQLNFVKLTDGSFVNMTNYPKFKKYLWLDLLRGETDLFDWSIQTDPVKKEVYIEPTHAYEIDGVKYPGFFNRKQLDWSQKVDLSKESELELFSDYERELIFKFKDDTNDGGLKKVQDRNQVTIGMAKYVLPPRYKTQKKEKENRFYSAVMHYNHDKFKGITGVSPQLIALIPENIANTSGSESENTFEPKRAWYKGNVSNYGGWKFNGIEYTTLPFMFAVNYKPGGYHDPVLSYSDQFIAGVVANGLLKKFFLQRMAIFRGGRRYNPIDLMLNNKDVTNFLHRESIVLEDLEFILTSIKDYNPVEPESTSCSMWMFLPVGLEDRDNTYPSIQNVQAGNAKGTFETKYWSHQLLTTDIPI